MLNKLTNRTYYMSHKESGDRPALGIVIGDNYSLIIDGGNSKAHAESFINEISKLEHSPLKYLVLTHHHWDHIVGATYMNLTTIVNGITKDKLDEQQLLTWTNSAIEKRIKDGKEIEFCLEHIKIEHPNPNRNFIFPKPEIVFDEFLKLDLGGVTVSLEHMPSDHTNDNTIILVEEENKSITFVGDSLYLDMFNGEWSYTKEKLITLLTELECYNSDFIVPSHHGIYTKETFSNFINHMRSMSNIVDESTSLDEVLIKFRRILGRSATKAECEDLKSFINGNMRK